MATSSRAERFKYGICLNDECEMCKNKTVQQIPMRKDLICESCGKPLRECPPPHGGGNKKLFIGGGVIAAAVVACGLYFGHKPSDAEEALVEPPVVVEEVDLGAQSCFLEGDGHAFHKTSLLVPWHIQRGTVAGV